MAPGAYAAAIAAIDPFVEVVSVPCGDLAMRIEAGTIDEPLVEEVRGYCAPLRDAGVDVRLLEQLIAEALADAVRRTAAGEAVFSPGLAEGVLEEYGRPPDPAQSRLTAREADDLLRDAGTFLALAETTLGLVPSLPLGAPRAG